MTDLTTDVTVTIHGTEMDLIASGARIASADPDVGIMRAYIEGCDLLFADGTLFPVELYNLVAQGEWDRVRGALDDALARGDFDPDPDRLREDRDERDPDNFGLIFDANPFTPEEAK